MVKKILILLGCTIFVLSFSGCNSVGPGRKPIDLTEKQKNDLIDYVRFMIVRNRHMVTQKEKEFIKVMPPMFRYTVDSNGYDVVGISWNLTANKTIKATGEGILFTRNMDWRVGITNKAENVYRDKETVRKFGSQKDDKATFKSFLPLLTQ
jgi:transposase-like protein